MRDVRVEVSHHDGIGQGLRYNSSGSLRHCRLAGSAERERNKRGNGRCGPIGHETVHEFSHLDFSRFRQAECLHV